MFMRLIDGNSPFFRYISSLPIYEGCQTVKRFTLLLILALPLFFIINCVGDIYEVFAPVQESEQTYEVVDSITWVGTNFIYSDSTPKKPLTAVYIYTDWCGWSRKMKSEVFTDSSVINTLHNYFNSVRVNPDIDSSVVYMDTTVTCRYFVSVIFDISGYPTTVILNGLNQEIGRIRGYKPADKVLAYLEKMIVR